jgi:hypothetical protein
VKKCTITKNEKMQNTDNQYFEKLKKVHKKAEWNDFGMDVY